jgi:hypothetical protein
MGPGAVAGVARSRGHLLPLGKTLRESLPTIAVGGGARQRSRVFDSAPHCAGRTVLERRAFRNRNDERGRRIVRTALACRSPSLPTRSSRRKVCPLGIRRCNEYCASDCSNAPSRLSPTSTGLIQRVQGPKSKVQSQRLARQLPSFPTLNLGLWTLDFPPTLNFSASWLIGAAVTVPRSASRIQRLPIHFS